MINRTKKVGVGGVSSEVRHRWKLKKISVVSVPILPVGDPVLLGGQCAPWGWVPLLLPYPHSMVLWHDPVIMGPFEEVTPGCVWGGEAWVSPQ